LISNKTEENGRISLKVTVQMSQSE